MTKASLCRFNYLLLGRIDYQDKLSEKIINVWSYQKRNGLFKIIISLKLTKNCSKDHTCIHCWDLFCKDFYGGKFDGLLRFHEWSKIRNFHEHRVSFSAHWDLFCKFFWLTEGLFWIRWPTLVWVKGQFGHLIFFWFHVQ